MHWLRSPRRCRRRRRPPTTARQPKHAWRDATSAGPRCGYRCRISGGESVRLPAASNARATIACEPATGVRLSVYENGAVVDVADSAPSKYHSTRTTPTLSDTAGVNTAPVIDEVGAVTSATEIVTDAVPMLPELSVTVSRAMKAPADA